MRLWAARRAVVLFMVRRWCGMMSPFSSEARLATSERGMSSSASSASVSSSLSGAVSLSMCDLVLAAVGSSL